MVITTPQKAGLQFERPRLSGWNIGSAKVLVETGSGQILGGHLLGQGAAQTIHTFAFAIHHG